MKQVSYEDIAAMNGNGSSLRLVLNCFLEKGANVFLLHEEGRRPCDRYFLVQYDGLDIPLRAFDLDFYSILNSRLAQTITINKQKTYVAAKAFSLPVPETIFYDSEEEAQEFLKKFGEIVVKPHNGAHGKGISLNVSNKTALNEAVSLAQQISSKVLLQQQVTGGDYRLLFVDYQFVAAVLRRPAMICGDGKHTIRELVEASNKKKSAMWRAVREGQTGANDMPGSISKTPLEEIIQARGEDFLLYTPSRGEDVQLLDKANVSLGGQTEDVTDSVSGELTSTISKLLRTFDLPLCGVDVISSDIKSASADGKSWVIELNAAPGLRLHESPMVGTPRHVCEQVVEALIRKHRALQ